MRPAKTVPQSPYEERLSPAERVTRQIKAALELGVRPWVKSWSDSVGASPALILPRRANGIPYRGINTLALWAAAEECGFASPYWFTLKQALHLKAAVRTGERGSFIIFYTELPGDADAPNTDDGKGDKKRILRGYTVFNACQIDGLAPEFFAEATPPAPRDDDDARLTALFAKLPITVRHGGDRAYYAMAPLDAQGRKDMLELVEERYGRTGLVVTSQLAVDTWRVMVGDPTYADAILDRVAHNSRRVTLEGDSIRKTKGRQSKSGNGGEAAAGARDS